MSAEARQSVLAHHAFTVVGDANQLASAVLNLDQNTRRTGIQRILDEFLYDRTRPLDNLTGRNLVGQVRRQTVDL